MAVVKKYLKYNVTLTGSSGAATALIDNIPLVGTLKSVIGMVAGNHANLVVTLSNTKTGEVYFSKTGNTNFTLNPRQPTHASADGAAISGGSTEVMLDPNVPCKITCATGNAGTITLVIGLEGEEYLFKNSNVLRGNADF